MGVVDEFRAGKTGNNDEPPRLGVTIAAAILAFFCGAAAILGWQHLPTLQRWFATITGSNGTSIAARFESNRIGRAATAPLLRTCAPTELLSIDKNRDVDPSEIYAVLKAGSLVDRVRGLAGETQDTAAMLALAWSQTADCIFKQNGWNLCDPDNRALAVDTVKEFARHIDQLPAVELPGRGSRPGLTISPASFKERIFESLRLRLRSGYLIEADFGFFTPAAIRPILAETKAVENACANRR